MFCVLVCCIVYYIGEKGVFFKRVSESFENLRWLAFVRDFVKFCFICAIFLKDDFVQKVYGAYTF